MTARRLPRPFAVFVAGSLMAGGAGLGLLELFPSLQAISRQAAMAASFIPYGILAWAVAALVLAFSARGTGRLFALIPLAAMAGHSLVLMPYFATDHDAAPGTAPTLKIVALNMHYGQADTTSLLRIVQNEHPDVVVLTEFTADARTVLDDPAWTSLLPYHAGTTGSADTAGDGDSSGTQVLSRTPLTPLGETTGTFATNAAVGLTANGHHLVLLAAHPVNPVRGGVSGWLSDAAAVTTLARSFAGQPLVLVGDLNAVPEHLTVRTLTQQAGLHEVLQGWEPTYPADRLVPLITIDHVLAGPAFRTIRVSRFHVDGTDHLGSIVELAQG